MRKESGNISFHRNSLPDAAPKLAESVLSARITAGSSAEALQRGDRGTAEKQIAEFDDELASIEQMAAKLSPALDETILAELESLREQLSALAPELDSADDNQITHAATLRTIADDLVRWHEQVVVSQSPMDDAMRAELALVSRQELVDAAVETASRDALRAIADRSHLRMFSFSRGLEELPADIAESPEDQEPDVQPTVLQSSEPVTSEVRRDSQSTKDGSATALGDALASALDRSAGEPVSTVVVLTDGANNTGSDPLAAARKLHDRGVRLG